MIINNIFTNFFAEDYINIEPSELIQLCYDTANQNKDFYSNILFDENNDSIKYIKNEVIKIINKLHLKIGLSKDYKQEIVSMWGNIGYPHRTTMPHCHHGTFFSAILYLTDGKDDGSGNLFFMNPDKQKSDYMRPNHIDTYNQYTSDSWKIKPSIGKLIVFPSWLWHYVCVDPQGEGRISIAIDTQIVRK
jgi:uncharacterized protein (TIGR02466 family)